MDTFKPYLDSIKDDEIRSRMINLLEWVQNKYPMLGKKIAWNQPHFTHHDTFIIAFTHAKSHVSIIPEYKVIDLFKDEIRKNNYLHTNFIYKVKWNQEMNYDLLSKIIEYNMHDKSDYNSYWR
ncbi:iron chaperone [Acholeplasma granularum]|uniref:iron chaperone n=1 Tax=Acholeplasma granularum TaxID=264635 RepID=UPI0004723195|nr:DUF1801 domain-containing protein [Acholeplasma granularum]